VDGSRSQYTGWHGFSAGQIKVRAGSRPAWRGVASQPSPHNGGHVRKALIVGCACRLAVAKAIRLTVRLRPFPGELQAPVASTQPVASVSPAAGMAGHQAGMKPG
jgi:hypothetical protein